MRERCKHHVRDYDDYEKVDEQGEVEDCDVGHCLHSSFCCPRVDVFDVFCRGVEDVGEVSSVASRF